MLMLKAPTQAALLVAFLAAAAFAADPAEESSTSASPDGVIENVSYYAEESADVSQPDCCCQSCTECCRQCDLGDPWTLFGESDCGVTVGGWISAGLFSNAHGAADNGPLGFNNVGDGMTFNQWWVYAEKVADTEKKCVDWGFRADFIFGADGPDTQAFGGLGWDTTWNTARDYGSALPQLYGEIATGDLSVKFGHFYTIIGWEVVPAPDNFFYSHSYTMYYAEPFTHTGVLASYSLHDDVTVYAGWTQGWDTGFDNSPGASTFLGGVSAPLGEKLTATWATTAGDFGHKFGNGDIYMNSLVLNYTISDKLTYILQHDLGVNTVAGASSQWYGINQYLQYQINDCWATGMRIEWFRDNDGARVITGNEGNYYELTWGLNWKYNANVMFRPELRYDWYSGTIGPEGKPFNNGSSTDQLSGGFDVIVTY